MSKTQVNFKQAAATIAAIGMTNTILLQGAPGVGKSSLLDELSRRMPDYLPCYIDVANLDLGDLAMPVVDKDTMTTSYAPNARFGVAKGQNRPVLLMLDELGKAGRSVMNMLLPVILEHRLGDVKLPAGSIVFATTNLASDGVGDNIPAHAYNRMTVMDFRNPTADEWLEWAATSSVAPEVAAFAKQFPQIFERYDTEGTDKNAYIFNPGKGRVREFCSPRSLAKASNIIKARSALGAALIPALSGTVGEAAARDLEAMVHLADQVPSFEAVVASPKTVKLPETASGYFLMAFMLAGRGDVKTFPAVMEYLDRWSETSFEGRALFVQSVCANQAQLSKALSSKGFTAMAKEIGKLLS